MVALAIYSRNTMSKKKLYIFLAGLSLAGYVWLGWSFIDGAGASSTPTVCLLKTVTHLPCPSCGTTRALVLLMKGDIGGSLEFNPLGILLAFALVTIPLWIITDTFRRTDSLYRCYVKGERLLAEKKWISVPAAAILVINWFWSIAKGL